MSMIQGSTLKRYNVNNMSRNFSFAPGEYYHIYNRGTEKRTIFKKINDYERFLVLLFLCNNSKKSAHLQLQGRTLKLLKKHTDREKLVEVCAYCLMPNHFHLILREITEGGISKFMQKVITGYTMYFNKKYDRSGALFQGKFKAVPTKDDIYLKYLISYIHLNPITLHDPSWKEVGIKNEREAKKFLDQYEYSSFKDYCGEKREQGSLLDMNSLPDYFETPRNFKESMLFWLNFKVEP